MNQIEIKEEKIRLKNYFLMSSYILKGVIQTFDNNYKSNGRIYDENFLQKYLRKYFRKTKIMSIFNEQIFFI